MMKVNEHADSSAPASCRNALISVIVPVYNTETYLDACILSLLKQTHQNIEVILVDDGSSDGSGAKCDRYEAQDKRVTVLHQPNRGVSSARNMGIELANGDYLHFMDSDDYLEENAYEVMLAALDSSDCDAVVCEYFVDYGDCSTRHQQDENLYGVCTGEEAAERLFTGFQFACTKLFPARLVECERFSEGVYRGEDTLFAASVLLKASHVRFIKDALYHYVQSKDSACRGPFRQNQLTIVELYPAYSRLYQAHGLVPPDCLWSYLHHNLIGMYYDVWATVEDRSEALELLNKVLRDNYQQARRAARGNMRVSLKFALATWTPGFFCRLHRRIHDFERR